MNFGEREHLVTDGAKSDVITMKIHVEVPQKSKSKSVASLPSPQLQGRADSLTLQAATC